MDRDGLVDLIESLKRANSILRDTNASQVRTISNLTDMVKQGMGKPQLNLNITNKLDIDDQLEAWAHKGKFALCYWVNDDEIVTFWKNISYMEKLFVIDSFQNRKDYDSGKYSSQQGEDYE